MLKNLIQIQVTVSVYLPTGGLISVKGELSFDGACYHVRGKRGEVSFSESEVKEINEHEITLKLKL